jgi:Transposase, Mutator family
MDFELSDAFYRGGGSLATYRYDWHLAIRAGHGDPRGVSTRRVDELVQAMGLSSISKSQVSKLRKDIDERVSDR